MSTFFVEFKKVFQQQEQQQISRSYERVSEASRSKNVSICVHIPIDFIVSILSGNGVEIYGRLDHRLSFFLLSVYLVIEHT